MAVKMVSYPIRMTQDMLEAISDLVHEHNQCPDRVGEMTHAHFIRVAIANHIHATRRLDAKKKLEGTTR
jgi:hypothetical protein